MSKCLYVLECEYKCKCKDKHWCCHYDVSAGCVLRHDLAFIKQMEDLPIYFIKKEKPFFK